MTTTTPVSPFRLAAEFVLPFGKFVGQRIDKVAEFDAGLLYLDWLRGELEAESKKNAGRLGANREALLKHLQTYLDDPTIANDVAKLAQAGR